MIPSTTKLKLSLLLLIYTVFLFISHQIVMAYNCYGYDQTSESVCGGHGVCQGNNKCYCVDASSVNTLFSPWSNQVSILQEGNSLISTSGIFNITMQRDGNLVLREGGTNIIYQTYTAGSGSGPYALLLSTNGSLVITGANGTSIVKKIVGDCTKGAGPYKLVIQNDGNFVLYSGGGAGCWVSDTWHPAYTNNNPYLWPGKACGETVCYSVAASAVGVCSGHGICNDTDSCLCDSGWTGSNCSISTVSCDLVNNCNGHGKCIANNTCECYSGWKGDETCSVPSCDGVNNCSGNGQCVSSNTCQCNSGWRGNLNCSSISCDALNECSSHGSCVSNNTCECQSGWKGNSQCSVFSCEERNQCSGNGQCISSNTCSCNSGWKGNSNCSSISCDTLNNCNGNGQCISNNTCQCNSGWRGNTQCSAISCDALNECSSHGSCISNNTCECQSGWKGNANCSIVSCENLNNCSGHGVCISSNTCSCNNYWKYVDCSINECLMNLGNVNNQLSCATQSPESKTSTFSQITTTVWDIFTLKVNGKQEIKVSYQSSLNLNLTSNYFLSSSSTPSNSDFYSNITNFMIQDSSSALIHVQLSKSIKYTFNNLDIDQNNYNYYCVRFDYNSNSWTNQSIDTSVSSTQVACSTSHITSVAVKRSISNRSVSSVTTTGDLSVILIAILVPTFFLLMFFCLIALIASIVIYIMNRKKQKPAQSTSTVQFEL